MPDNAKTMQMVKAMQEEFIENPYQQKIYNTGDAGSDVQKRNQQVIQGIVGAMAHSLKDDNVERVNLNDLEAVKSATIAYVKGCQMLGRIPSMSGLATYGLHCTRQWIAKFKSKYPEHQTTLFLDAFSEMIADAVINGGLAGAMNAPMSIFLLKNHGYSDRVEVESIITDATDDETYTASEIAKRYLEELSVQSTIDDTESP